MTDFSQGDILRIKGYKYNFVITSNNAFIKATGVFHVCPLLENVEEGPLHIIVAGKKDTSGAVICEQIKLIDPAARACNRIDSLYYADILNVSDAIQGVFEYD
jgi:mRNA-degrading endonuclease toxin of MazEF toxin-antitoxin module